MHFSFHFFFPLRRDDIFIYHHWQLLQRCLDVSVHCDICFAPYHLIEIPLPIPTGFEPPVHVQRLSRANVLDVTAVAHVCPPLPVTLTTSTGPAFQHPTTCHRAVRDVTQIIVHLLKPLFSLLDFFRPGKNCRSATAAPAQCLDM